ncbi:MAG: 16S rRNA (adenine(1518)-N(6)/adenine(1519)-N(6))-dimethyltransferase RsmA [Prolixibacteraceae bacterium]|jgi:16S rRNA (adenine1518-N6/adenine1519-N6)-dimethyltransferase|nr:16S rRNA (adenine(1518)-N(6)/adenine(1519)-N(6))-dimethyltransferase RsmA [Prolixibacteraceae bacterium]
MAVVKAKKHLGQHFLADQNIARKIVGSLSPENTNILEVGPGMGVLTHLLFSDKRLNVVALDVDTDSVTYLKEKYPEFAQQIFDADFLKTDLSSFFPDNEFTVIGNFPYNISSQIFFKVLDNKSHIPEVVGMIQKEVAERMAAKPGSKTFGVLSVLIQAYYSVEYLFTVHEHVFKPPPKVKSAVVRLSRKDQEALGCDEVLFKRIVKTMFNQRRKMIRNSIRPILKEVGFSHPFLEKRPEQLSIDDFVEFTNVVEHALKE